MFTREEKKILWKMKYFSDQSGLIDRYLNEAERWDDHLKNTRKFIIDCVNKYKPETIALLGSGWWLDVPVEELSAICKKVYLVDIMHPKQIVHKTRKFQNLNLVEYDVTGGTVFEAYNIVKQFRKNRYITPVTEIPCPGFQHDIKADYYVSLNMLNQIDSLIIEYLKKYRIYSDDELKTLRKRIQEAHLRSLPKGRSCLITDVEEMIFYKDKQEKVIQLLSTELPEGKRKTSWTWDFDRSGTFNPGKTTRFRIVGIKM